MEHMVNFNNLKLSIDMVYDKDGVEGKNPQP